MPQPMLTASTTGSQAVVAWASLTNFAYTIQATPDLAQPWIDAVLAAVPGTGGTMTYTNTNPSQARYFRLKADPRP